MEKGEWEVKVVEKKSEEWEWSRRVLCKTWLCW